VIEERCISTRKPVLITGAHASGKSYWLDRLRENAARIWASRAEAKPLHLAATRPLPSWTDVQHLELWWASRENSGDERHWSKLRAWERVDMLPVYLQETGAVLFVDDAHGLSGRKLKVAQECVRAATVWVMAAADEGRIAPGLRKDVLAADPQIFRLGSEVAYDATPIFMWILITLAFAAGSWELGMALAGLKFLGSGRRAAKQT
jgi:diadenosine tetraphosphatase ApaH/serine/threonine PP2A family protein phosphatase